MGSSLGFEAHGGAWQVVPASCVRAQIARAFVPPGDDPAVLGEVVLRSHQLDGVRRLRRVIEIFGGALLADDVGMGKTFTALAAARGSDSVVVVAPAALRRMWNDAVRRTGQAVVILSYEQLSTRRIELPNTDFVIADEAHHARNPRTRRYDALARLTRRGKLLLLTATPIHNREHDLRHLLALFLGARALDADDAVLRACTVRRTPNDSSGDVRLPQVSRLRWLSLPQCETVVQALSRIPAPVPPQDGGTADALLAILLLRLWCSSDWALRSALRRLLLRATSLTAALQDGRYPRRHELDAWRIDDGALQLAFAPLVALTPAGTATSNDLLRRLDVHVGAVTDAMECLARHQSADAVRQDHLERMIASEGAAGIIAFTQFRDTARGLFRRLRHLPGVVMLSSEGGETAAGRLSREEVLALARPRGAHRADPRLPLRLLIATDLLSEGVNLGQLQHLVHVDLPWTPARAHQRLGRLRRPESPHLNIDVSAFELPVAAERLVGVVRTLQAKARASGRLIGEGELLSGAPWAGEDSVVSSTAQLDADAELRDRLRTWQHDGFAATASRSTGPPTVAVVPAGRSEWRALVLAYVEGLPRLLLLSDGECSDEAANVLQALDDFSGADSLSHDVLPSIRRRLDAWLSTQRAEAMTRSVVHASSPGHTQALRALARVERSLPRRQRLRDADRIAQAKRALLTGRGAGAERALNELLRVTAQPRNADAWLGLLEGAMTDAERGTATVDNGDAPFDEPQVVCVLVGAP